MPETRFFSHAIDPETFYCTRCGRFLAKLQAERVWKGNTVHPVCPDGVTGISHIARGDRHA